MELRQLRYLVAVADTGSFTAAARRVFVTQPTLSSAIATLERELGTCLFERSTRGVMPTDAGHEAIAHARTALLAAASLRSVAASQPPQRPLRLGVSPAVAPDMLLDALRILRAADRSASVRIEEASTTALARRLLNGRLDVTLSTFAADPDPARRRLQLGTDSMGLAYPDHEAPDPPVTPEILHGRPLIVRTHCDLLSAASRILDDRHIRPVITARTDSDERALALVAAGHGACLVPDSIRAPGITIVAVDDIDLVRHIGLEWQPAVTQLNHLTDTAPT